ncbi:MAG: Sensor kinase CckA [Verrucomicrobia subdivision 3 bacterium]|nr:Sensor kinase CckA [Limisphaerales bacterium]MCS1416978.1 Sensor kinase CckA [Limisphaerales bacterium]
MIPSPPLNPCQLLILGALCFLGANVVGQNAFNWRSFTTANGLTNSAINSVTIGPKGTVWLKHDDLSAVTRFDGYQFDTYHYPSSTPSRVFEGRSSQLWAVDKDAVLQQSGGPWLRFPLAPIHQEYRQNIRRVTQPISMIPLRINKVLILLSDQLIRFDSQENQMTQLKHVGKTQLGKFKDMIELKNESLFVTGELGIAQIHSDSRSLTPDADWTELTFQADAKLRDFQRPTENLDGSVSMIATGENQTRYIATVQNHQWQIQSVDRLKLRFAWKRPGGYWGQSYNSIYRITEDGATAVGQDEVSAGLFMDVAVESPDIFLVASSEGLFRHAPSCWQKPLPLADIDSSAHGILEDRQQRLWFLSSDALLKRTDKGWQRFPWPDDAEVLFRSTATIFELDDGTLLISNQGPPLAFNPATERITRFVAANGEVIQKVLGLTQDQKPIVLWKPSPDDESPSSLGQLEGRRIQPFPPFPDPWPEPTELNFITETSSGKVWFGDQAGIGIIEDLAVQRFGFEQGLPRDRATSLVKLDNGLIWAGLGAGIYEYDGKRWKGLFFAQDRINAIVQTADESIWVASNQGLHRYHYNSWVSLTIQDGLAGNAIYSVAEDQKGQIWAAAARGINRYYPDADIDPPRSSIRILAHAPDPRGSNTKWAVFDAQDKWDSTPKKRLLFSYRLDQGPWSPYTEKNDLILKNLAGGQHRLEVRAMDRNWNEESIASDCEFMWIIPWHQDPRLLIISVIGIGVIILLAGLAINRHIQLTRSYAQVEKIVAVRTAELEAANRELLQTQKMRALGTLSAGIAHDFNGILNIIKGSTQIIEANLENREKALTRLQRIRLVVDQGAGVIRAMLGLARSNDEKHLRTADINQVVQTTIQLMDDRLPKELKIKFLPTPDLPSVQLATDLLQQTLVNLISNASDAMDGQGSVLIKTGQLDRFPPGLILQPGAAQSYNYIFVQDTGYGIPEEILPRIFEPFFTSKSFSSKRGTGLGLSMVYEMARELQTGLSVESTAGKGSKFALYIPVAASPEVNP